MHIALLPVAQSPVASCLPTMAGNFALVKSLRLWKFWRVCRKKFAKLVHFLIGCLRPALQMVLLGIFFVFFGLPLVEKYKNKEVINVFSPQLDPGDGCGN